MLKNILLVEPDYHNKFPPLGLMKISSYHKLRGDNVKFVKGCINEYRLMKWDRIYISTLFSFFWKKTTDTIKYYSRSVKNTTDIVVGGVMATLFSDEIEKEFNVKVVKGLLNTKGILDNGDNHIIDTLIPDYSILKDIEYNYGIEDSYIGYATRGCPNNCTFCAVNKIEPAFDNYLPIKRQVRGIEALYGEKRNLILCDNNVLASESFTQIIEDIIELGFEKGATFQGKLRFVDFNQGIDARLLDDNKMEQISKIAIRPLRIAFDNIKLKGIYVGAVKIAAKYDVLNLSNYILYNYHDKPEHFYDRLRINIELNEKIGTKIYSFPMRYIPLLDKDRSYCGKHWNKKILRGIQCVLLATRGKVGPTKDFFEAAFGSNYDEFRRITLMPDDYIIYREDHKNNGALDWTETYRRLTENQKIELLDRLSLGKISIKDVKDTSSARLKKIYSHYIESDRLVSLRRKDWQENNKNCHK